LLKVLIDNIEVNQCISTKFLGVLIDENLSWKTHTNQIENKISSVIGIMSKIRYKIDHKTCLMIYDSLINSHLEYCNAIWTSVYKTHLNKIFILQKRALRICLRIKLNYRDDRPSIDIFKLANKLSIYNINKLHTAKIVYQCLNGLISSKIISCFSPIASIHEHGTRQRNQLFTSRSRLNLRKMSFANAGIKIWNNLPVHIRDSSNTLSDFTHKLKNYINDYSLDV